MFAGQIDLDEDGYIVDPGNVLTTRNGVGGAGRLCVRRRAGPALSPGDYGGRVGLHGGAGGGEVSRGARALIEVAGAQMTALRENLERLEEAIEQACRRGGGGRAPRSS